ncbi:MAG: indole-3-glycerol phosphate synthase TrpC [Tannerellaceae bacterium]
MKDILQEIIACKRIEVDDQREAVSLNMLLALASEQMSRPTRSMRMALAASPSGIIAEFKRKSPSKGWLHADATVSDILPAYERAGAAACSVLTDEHFFGGALGDLKQARQKVDLPLLRKDFIVDEYQLYQARAMGADAVLLIAACLTPDRCLELTVLAHALDLEVLLEVHTEEEFAHINPQIDMLGINNRHLGTFQTEVENSFRLSAVIKQRTGEESIPLLVSESGIPDPVVARRLRDCGFRGLLIGETFMKSPHPGDALSAFIGGMLC